MAFASYWNGKANKCFVFNKIFLVKNRKKYFFFRKSSVEIHVETSETWLKMGCASLR